MKQIKPTEQETSGQIPASESIADIVQQAGASNTSRAETPEQPKKPGKDFLGPAIVFIGLFFAFFILITIQKLTKDVVHPEDTAKTGTPTVIIKEQPQTEPSTEEQIMMDNQKETSEVADDLLNEIDSVGNVNVDQIIDETDLDNLE